MNDTLSTLLPLEIRILVLAFRVQVRERREESKMKVQRAAILITIVAITLAFFQCAPTVSASKNPKVSWTFMVYLDADNSLDWFGPVNLRQMSDGLAPGASVNVVVLMDRLNLPAYTYEVTYGGIKIVQSLGEVDMGSPDTLTWFVTFAMKNYPATYFFLDLWDHGGGYRGVCWDESSGNHLSPHDVETALASAESKMKKRIHVVGFDACLMGMAEITYELKDVTDIVVGSEMLIPGYGWPYTQLMTYLSNNPTVDPYTLSTELVKEYVAYYPYYTVQLSAINEAVIPEFTESLNRFADTLRVKVSAYQEVIAGARSKAQQKFILGTMGVYFYIDLYKFAQLVGERTGDEEIAERSQDLMNKLDVAVFAEAHTAKLGNLDARQFGLTINFPPNGQAYSTSYETYVPCFVQETSWFSFLMAYYEAM